MENDSNAAQFNNLISVSSFHRKFRNGAVNKVKSQDNEDLVQHSFSCETQDHFDALKREISLFSKAANLPLPFASIKSFSLEPLTRKVDLYTECYPKDLLDLYESNQSSSTFNDSLTAAWDILHKSDCPNSNQHHPSETNFPTKVMYGIAYAIQILNSHGLVHREINPSHICLNSSYEPILIDFGISRPFKHTNCIIDETSYDAFMAPEVVGNPQPTPKADVYSLGMILIWLDEGTLTFNKTQSSVLPPKELFHQIKIKRRVPNLPKTYKKNTNNDKFLELIQHCIELDPEHRWSISDVIHFLHENNLAYPDNNIEECRAYIESLVNAVRNFTIPQSILDH